MNWQPVFEEYILVLIKFNWLLQIVLKNKDTEFCIDKN